MKTNNINKNCTHNGVRIEFNYYGGEDMVPEEGGVKSFTAHQTATVDGRSITGNDRYDLQGNRLTEKTVWDNIFTEEYYTELDKAAKAFANDINNVI